MLSEYTIYRKDRTIGGGGVFIGVKRSLTVLEEPELVSDCETIWIKLHCADSSKSLYICSYYRPPDNNIHSIAQLNKSFTKLFDREATFPLILLVGDFNFPDILWLDGHGYIKPSPAYGYEINNSFLDFIDENNLEQVVAT